MILTDSNLDDTINIGHCDLRLTNVFIDWTPNYEVTSFDVYASHAFATTPTVISGTLEMVNMNLFAHYFDPSWVASPAKRPPRQSVYMHRKKQSRRRMAVYAKRYL